MPRLIDIAPNIAALEAAPLEDIAWAILGVLRRLGRQTTSNTVAQLVGTYQPPLHEGVPFSRAQRQQISRVVSEAIGWLVNKGLVSIEYDGGHIYHVASRLGLAVDTDEKFRNFVLASTISAESLHETIRDTCWPLYVRGEFDTAVFAAFKRVEVCVRDAAGLATDQIGTTLMRAAFHKETGQLSDTQAQDAEKDAMAHLFAGAIGLFKNPNSHRDVGLDDPVGAAEVLMFASHLLRIVENIDVAQS